MRLVADHCDSLHSQQETRLILGRDVRFRSRRPATWLKNLVSWLCWRRQPKRRRMSMKPFCCWLESCWRGTGYIYPVKIVGVRCTWIPGQSLLVHLLRKIPVPVEYRYLQLAEFEPPQRSWSPEGNFCNVISLSDVLVCGAVCSVLDWNCTDNCKITNYSSWSLSWRQCFWLNVCH